MPVEISTDEIKNVLAGGKEEEIQVIRYFKGGKAIPLVGLVLQKECKFNKYLQNGITLEYMFFKMDPKRTTKRNILDPEELKTAKYVCLTDKGYIFQPLAFEIQREVEPSTSTFLKNLCKKLCVFNQENRAGSFFRQRLSLAIQAGNAAIVVGTVRDEDHLSEPYYL